MAAVSKVMSLREAVERFVGDGSHLSIGGFTVSRNSMAAVHEIIRRGRRNRRLARVGIGKTGAQQ